MSRKSQGQYEIEILDNCLINFNVAMHNAQQRSQSSYVQMKSLLELLTGPHQPNHLHVVEVTREAVEAMSKLESEFRHLRSINTNLHNLHGYMEGNAAIRASEDERIRANYRRMQSEIIALTQRLKDMVDDLTKEESDSL